MARHLLVAAEESVDDTPAVIPVVEHFLRDDPARGATIEGGKIEIPDRPGLGVESVIFRE